MRYYWYTGWSRDASNKRRTCHRKQKPNSEMNRLLHFPKKRKRQTQSAVPLPQTQGGAQRRSSAQSKPETKNKAHKTKRREREREREKARARDAQRRTWHTYQGSAHQRPRRRVTGSQSREDRPSAPPTPNSKGISLPPQKTNKKAIRKVLRQRKNVS